VRHSNDASFQIFSSIDFHSLINDVFISESFVIHKNHYKDNIPQENSLVSTKPTNGAKILNAPILIGELTIVYSYNVQKDIQREYTIFF